MSNFRRLPPVLRVASLLRPLFPLGFSAVFVYLVTAGWWSSAHLVVFASRAAVIAGNLLLVGLGCSLVVRRYNSRFRQPSREPFPLASWQSQVRALLALEALPLCALVLALVISPTVRAFQVVFPVTLIGAVVFLAVALSMGVS